jgi:hypothetical protein
VLADRAFQVCDWLISRPPVVPPFAEKGRNAHSHWSIIHKGLEKRQMGGAKRFLFKDIRHAYPGRGHPDRDGQCH